MTITSLARCVRVRMVVVRVGAKITRFIRQLAGQRKVWLKGNEKESAIASSFFSFERAIIKEVGCSVVTIDPVVKCHPVLGRKIAFGGC